MMRAEVAVLFVLSGAAAAADDTFEALRRMPVQDDGRVKPLDTFARETARRVTGARAFGAESVAGLDPVEWIVAVWASPEAWRQQRIVRVADAAFRAHVGLPGDRERFSFEEVVGNERFMAAAEDARGRQESRAALSGEDEKALRLYGDLSLMAAVLAGDAPKVAAVGLDG